jgi:hypothetical protein
LYVLPGYTDFEGHTASIGVGASPASFIVWNSVSKGFNISPSTQSQVGSYPVSINLRDGGASTSYSLVITVVNRAPIWSSEMISMTVPCSSIQTQTVPAVSDPDPGASLTISFAQSSPATTLSTTTSGGVMTLTVSPTTLAEVGTHTV